MTDSNQDGDGPDQNQPTDDQQLLQIGSSSPVIGSLKEEKDQEK